MRSYVLIFIMIAGLAGLAGHAAEQVSASGDTDLSETGTPTGFQQYFTLAFDHIYPDGFQNFHYVETLAPKGGTMKYATQLKSNYSTMNPCLPDPAEPPPGLSNMYETLMTTPADEPQAAYPQLARGLEIESGCKSVTFSQRKCPLE